MAARPNSDPLAPFQPAVRQWFSGAFGAPTRPQALGWPPIARGESSLILAPTGSGKTLAAFLWCLDRLMFAPPPPRRQRCRVLYISPLKALAADVERNLRTPLAGIARTADGRGDAYTTPSIAVRTGDTPASDRARFARDPADILITTPESLYLLLTSRARDRLTSIDTIVIDEIHALVPTKRGAHLMISVERLASRCERPPQRIGLSATQRPLDEVARFLGGVQPAVGGRQSAVASHQSSARSRPGHRGSAVDEAQNEVAGEFAIHGRPPRFRPVTIVDAGAKKPLQLRVEVPVEEMRIRGSQVSTGSPTAPGSPSLTNPANPSIWSAIHPRLLELIRGHRSTLIFANSRRLAERLAGALNDLAGETLVRSHHGSIARAQRVEVEELLKAGTLRALVATSSLELGIDMGAIDLVIQIEAPPSVASGLQRIGRGGHHAGAVSAGVIFPKFRGDLVACAAVARAMHDGAVEATRYPRNPLDVLAQQIVAMASMDGWNVNELFATLRRAAPFAELGRGMFDGVLDMLSGRYPSDEFAELRPRITWDRTAGVVTAREGARHVAIINGGTIPDRGLYGVFLAGAGPARARVGELDEEMVFESRVGDTFVLGASSWRIEEITHDRVLVSPAPGEPGRMPFWKGDRPGRPIELGLAIGRLMHDLVQMPATAASVRLTRDHDLDESAAANLLQYLRDQQAATRALPDADTLIVERVRDELGDWRVCVLSPRGGRVHAPWAMAAAAKIREARGIDVEILWGDDGFVVRFPDVDQPPDPALLMPDPDEVQALVVRQLGATALFAGKFRENAARSLLLPKRRPGMRAPLWQQRKRSADLLSVASRYGSFPVLLETYRECLRDFFDIPALVATLADVRRRKLRIVTVDAEKPSPFAASLLFSYVASFLYDGDAPLAERRAQALSVDQAQLRELVGDAELRELLDPEAMEAIEQQLQRLDPRYRARSADGVHDLLIAVGDLAPEELGRRTETPAAAAAAGTLVAAGRLLEVSIAGERRFIASEDAARYRDGLGVTLPPGVPGALLQPVRDPLGDLVRRYARTHAPFTSEDLGARFALGAEAVEAALKRLASDGALIEGEFRAGRTSREWTDAGVLRMVRRRSLAKLRREIEPVDQAVLGRFVTMWQGAVGRRRGADALLDAVEQLQGAALPASIVETEILPARVDGYDPADLDALVAAGEIVWVGVEPIGDRDGRIALYLADQLAALLPPQGPAAPVPRSAEGPALRSAEGPALRSAEGPALRSAEGPALRSAEGPALRSAEGPALRSAEGPALRSAEGKPDRDSREQAILEALRARGASFFGPLHDAVGGGYPGETVSALWALVWDGLVTNDTMHALRAFTRVHAPRRRAKRPDASLFRSRRLVPASAEGRWSLVAGVEAAQERTGAPRSAGKNRATAHLTALTRQLLARHGVLTREAVAAESIPGGFGAVYPVLKAMEDAGRVRRGYFVAGLGATQFALPGAVDMLRSLRDRAPADAGPDAPPEVAVLAATDPANPYGATLKWPAAGDAGRGPTRSVGAAVILVDGALAAYLARGDGQLLAFLPDEEPPRSRAAHAVAAALIERARAGGDTPRGMLIEEIDGAPADAHALAPYLVQAGFARGALGLQATFDIR